MSETSLVRRPRGRLKTEVFRTSAFPASALRPPHPSRFSRKSRKPRGNNAIRVITACGFLHCQSDCSGTECAFPRASWHKVEPCSVQSSPSALSWPSPIRPLHNNPQPHPHHCPQGLWLMSQLSPNFVRLATSAGNQMQGRGVKSSLIDLTVRKDCVHTRTRREPIAH